MVKSRDDMTLEEKVESMSARLDEIGGVVIELEKQIRGLQAEIARQKSGTGRPILKLARIIHDSTAFSSPRGPRAPSTSPDLQ